jgi:hypothetical protein
VSFRIEITTSRGETRSARIDGARVWLGSGEEAQVRLRLAGVAARHLCFVRTDIGYRVEPRDPGATVAVNGEHLFCKDLEDGDQIELAGLTLRWRADAAAAAAAEPAAASPAGAQQAVHAAPGGQARAGRAASQAARRSPAARKATAARGAGWLPFSAIFLVVVIGAVLVLRAFSGSTWPQSPQHYVELARAQVGNNQPQRALDTLAFALREATGSTREEALALQAEIERMQVERSELPKLQTARHDLELLRSFVGRHLAGAASRPAARELLARCQQWRGQYGELCSRHSAGAELLREVDGLASRFGAIAAMETPETAADVLFVLQVLPEHRWRDYKRAMARLDAFLLANPNAEEVRKAREQALVDGEAWLQGLLRQIDALLARGDRFNAQREVDQLERFSVLPAWMPLLEPRRQRLAGG